MDSRNLLYFFFLVALCFSGCIHDQFIKNTTIHYYNDLSQKRLLQTSTTGPLRIFMDYTQVTVGGVPEINMIKRMMNVTANYFYNVLTVQRLDRLFFPSNTSQQCNILRIPDTYVTQGTIGDIGVVVGNENVTTSYMAKSTPCAFLASNRRPIWGVVIWNINSFKYNAQGFQQMIFVGLHQMTHVLAFSAVMYHTFPSGPVNVTRPDGSSYLTSGPIRREVANYYGCQGNNIGLELQDQDGTLIASHWQKHNVGNEYMIASNKKQSYVSRFTLALFQSTGWYPSVNYNFSEPMTWGKNKGCSFFNIDDCNFTQFCNDNSFQCDWDATAIGRCSLDPFTGSCGQPKYFTNTICIDQNYQLVNLNNLNLNLNTQERGGHNSRCIASDFRESGKNASALNYRCYVNVCSASGQFLYILVGGYTLVCRSPGQVIPAIPGMDGTLTCPNDFSLYCAGKKTCPFNCNQNGACINGRCLCTGSVALTTTCTARDFSTDTPISTGVRLLFQIKQGSFIKQRKSLRRYSFGSECSQGLIFDPISNKCQSCIDLLGCKKCNQKGCIKNEQIKEE